MAIKSNSTGGTKTRARKNVTGNIKKGKQGINNMVNSASKIVFRAANILEEEIARGIIAAKQIEGRMTDVDKLRGGNNEELLTRFRKDAHDIIDLIIDFSAIAIKNVGHISSRFMNIRQEMATDGFGTASQEIQSHIPLIQVPKELKAGEWYDVPITLENDDSNEVKSVHFENTILVDAQGNQVTAEAISFEPNPLVLQPGSSDVVTLKIKIPDSAKAGSYTCFIQGKNISNLKATLLIKVVE
ncbi:MAG: hypothetical protein ABR502_08095 [Chitinophagaceae bacterium]